MAEDEKVEAEQASSEQVETTETQVQEQAQEEEQIDWESRHKELEAEHTKLSQKSKENEQLLELVTPHVDWNKVQGGSAPAESAEDGESEEQFISRKAHDEALRKVQQGTDVKLLTMQFRTEHPDLKPYENTLVVPEIARLRRANPSLTADQLLEKATKFATDFLEAERQKGTEAKAKEDKAKSVETAKASGFASAGTTAPKKPESSGGESTEDYIARRKEQSRKARGLLN
jgi:hypothetical protein